MPPATVLECESPFVNWSKFTYKNWSASRIPSSDNSIAALTLFLPSEIARKSPEFPTLRMKICPVSPPNPSFLKLTFVP